MTNVTITYCYIFVKYKLKIFQVAKKPKKATISLILPVSDCSALKDGEESPSTTEQDNS